LACIASELASGTTDSPFCDPASSHDSSRANRCNTPQRAAGNQRGKPLAFPGVSDCESATNDNATQRGFVLRRLASQRTLQTGSGLDGLAVSSGVPEILNSRCESQVVRLFEPRCGMLTRSWLMAASVVGGVAGFSLGGTDCKIGDDFSGGGLTDIWEVGQSSGSVVSATESGGQIRFSAAANTDYSFDIGFAFSSDWYMDMTSDWAISAWWYSNPPTPSYGDTGLALAVMLDATPSTAYLTYGATMSVGRYNVDEENFRYEVCNRWINNDYYLIDQDPYYTDTSGTLYVWYDESADKLYFGDVLYGGSPFIVDYFQSGSPSNSQQARIGFGAYSFAFVPAYGTSNYRGDNFCILDGDVIGPDVGACCFGESCVETIAFSCDGEWQGVQTDCSYCDADSCYGDVDGDGSVSSGDITALIGYWGDPGGSGDVDGNEVVDVHDLLALLESWGTCPA
jgi:hypothetical protein